ncbi:MAG TPA: hypothetical protein VJ866_03605 [Pyrinomonadaceae bacterium]|nr:hypothetical protein [Pyrinomonadaceae bacterium]
MAAYRKRVIILTAAGLLYGAALAFFGLGVANGGDGVLIPLYIFGAPLFIPLFFLAPVVLWPAVGFLLGRAGAEVYKKAFLAVMAAHYLGAAAYLLAWGDWEYLSKWWGRSPSPFIIAFGLYVAGQVAIWITFAGRAAALQPTADA